MKSFFLSLLLVFFGFSLYAKSIHIVQKGKSKYQLLENDKGSDLEKKAISEFQRLFKLSTKIDLAKTNTVLTGIKYISILQDVDYLLNSGEKIADDGFLILFDEKNLKIIGGSGKGVLYGVYSFFEKYLGYRCFSPTVFTYPSLQKITLSADLYDYQAPLNSYRNVYYHAAEDSFYRDWHKLDHMKPDWGLWVHTFSTLVSATDHFSAHPEYFALVDGQRIGIQHDPNLEAQLCLSNRTVFELLVKKLGEFINKNPKAKYWSVSQNDTYPSKGYQCECDKCQEIDEATGSPSGSIISFVNKVAEKYPDHIISTLAYRYSRKAPKGIVPAKNVNIMFCSIECDRQVQIKSDSLAVSFREDFEDWSSMTDNIMMWDYVVQFSDLYAPFPNLHVLKSNIQYFVDNEVHVHFQQGNISKGGEFSELKPYLISKLLWDHDIDEDAVIDDFLKGYYAEAAPYVREYIDLMKEELVSSNLKLSIYGSPIDHKDGFLREEAIVQYEKLFNKAEQKVAHNVEVLDRVKIVRMSLNYALFEIAKARAKNDGDGFLRSKDKVWGIRSLTGRLEEFYALCNKYNLSTLKENAITPHAYYNATKLFFEGYKN